MKKNEVEEVLDKKVRARLKEDVLNEINTTVKEDLVSSVVSGVKEEFDNTYKTQIKEEITNDIKSDIEESVKKDQKKLSRKKTFKIFRLNIYIILLIICSLFLVYRLYQTDSFEYMIVKKSKTETTEVTTTTTESPVHDLAWLVNKYGNLLNKAKVTNIDLFKGNYDAKNIKMADKLAMAYKNLNKDKINVEGIILKISSESLEESYNEIFNDGLYKAENFYIDEINFAYSSSSKEYIAISSNTDDKSIVTYHINNIVEEKNKVIISVNVAYIANNNIYNIFDISKPVKESSTDISDCLDDLSKVDFTFEYSNGDFHLIKIQNK